MKLFRAYGLYNGLCIRISVQGFLRVSKLFRAYGLYNYRKLFNDRNPSRDVSKLFRAYGLYDKQVGLVSTTIMRLQSSFELTGYITSKCR